MSAPYSFPKGLVLENGCIARSGGCWNSIWVTGYDIVSLDSITRGLEDESVDTGLRGPVQSVRRSRYQCGVAVASRSHRRRAADVARRPSHMFGRTVPFPVRRAPSREALEIVLDGLVEALFPRHYGRSDLDTENIDYFVGNTLNIALNGLLEQVHRGSLFVSDGPASDQVLQDAIELTRTFASTLPETRGVLVSDLRAAFVGDPAATSFPEILIGFIPA